MHIFVNFTLEHHLVLPLADGALHPEHQLLGGLRLLPQDGLGLTSKALLLAIVPVMFILEEYLQTKTNVFEMENAPPSALGLLGLSRFLVLGHLR